MSVDQVLYLALIFIAVVAAVLAIGFAFGREDEVQQRLRGLSAGVGPSMADHSPEVSEWRERVIKAATPVARLATPTSEEELTEFRAKFLNAGIRSPSAPVLFFAAKALLAVALPLGLFLLVRNLKWELSTQMATFLLLLVAAIGYYLPSVVLARMTAARQRDLFDAFPDALDLIIVCVEAEEMRLRSPVLAEELELMSIELRVGSSRERALRNLALRTGVEEIGSFATMLIQADRFGTSLADSLRVHADMLRTRRRLRAEEAAAKIPLKLLFPLIFCIFPSLMLVLLGPAFIQVYRILLPAAGAN
jgi:tight adherence protein C